MVIINNEIYDKKGKERHGTQEDVKKLIDLAQNLQMESSVINDENVEEIETQFENACRDLNIHDRYFVCAILSHGRENRFTSVKGKKFRLSSFVAEFRRKSKDKNVVGHFCIQACRGSGASDEKEIKHHIEVFCDENVLITFATVYGEKAFRHRTKGSPFIKEMCKSLNQWKNLEIMQVMTIMKHNLEKHEDAPSKIMASSTTKLTRTFFLEPTTSHQPSTRVYETSLRSRGLFLIVGDTTKFPTDIAALREVAKYWGFYESNVKIVCQELQNDERNMKIIESGKEALLHKLTDYVQGYSGDSLVCAIISERDKGDKFVLKHQDESYNLSEVTSLVQGSKEWIEKPKLFFVQKSEVDWSRDPIKEGPEANQTYIHPEADVLITFSSSGRANNPNRIGISAFYDALLHSVEYDEHQEYYDLFKILTKVRKRMKDNEKEIPWTQTQLRKEVRFPKSGPVTEE